MSTHPNRKKKIACRKTKQQQRMKNVKNDKVCGEKIKTEAGGAMTSRCECSTNTASIHYKAFPGTLLDGPDYRCDKQRMQVKTGKFEGTQRRERKRLCNTRHLPFAYRKQYQQLGGIRMYVFEQRGNKVVGRLLVSKVRHVQGKHGVQNRRDEG